MLDDNRFGFKIGDLDLIITVIQKYPQIEQAIVFGSRAKGNYKTGSDVDIALKGDIDWEIVSNLNNDLNEETTLPYMFDVLDYNSIDNIALREHIDRIGVVFYEREKVLKQGWEIKKLGDVAKISAGNSAPQKKELFESGVYPFFRTSDIGQIRKGVIEFANDYLNEQGVKGLKLFKKGTILLPKSGASTFLNHRVMMQVDGYVSSHLATIKADNNKMDDKFLLYYLTIIDAKDLIQDVAYPSLKVSEISIIPIPIPPLPEQQRIVAILDKAFFAIDQAKQHAKQNLKNAKELFNSYLQNIDAKKVSLSDLVNISTGKLNSNEAVENGKYPFFTCSREVFAIDKYAFDLEAILLAGNNASGDFNVKHYNGKFNAYQRTYIITVNEKCQVLYRYLYFQLLNSLKEFKNQSVGANTRFLKIGMIYNLQIPLPNIKEQNEIINILDNILSKTKQLETIYQQKLTKLEELKKSILQKAFRGELN